MKNKKADQPLIPRHAAQDAGEAHLQRLVESEEGYTVIGRTIIDHSDLRRWIRWTMIAIVFAAIVLGVVTGHGLTVGTWTGAIEGALLVVRRWFFPLSGRSSQPLHGRHSEPVEGAPLRSAPSLSPTWRGHRSSDLSDGRGV